jgi:phospholipid/cholesterol/gamma-HCH transport system ATP-binding protein
MTGERGSDHPLELRDVVAVRGGDRVLDGGSFAVARHRINVLIGPSGVGKTLCVRMLVGLERPDSGLVLMGGRDCELMTDAELRKERRGMSVMLQGATLFAGGVFMNDSVYENVAFPLRARESLGRRELDRRVKGWLGDLGLSERAPALPGELSAGMQRRVALARALVSGSETVILDGLETGIDVPMRRTIADAIRARQRESGATYLIVSHDADLVRRLADVLIVLRRGRVEQIGAVEAVLADPGSFAARFLVGDTESGLGMASERPGA